MPHVIAAFEKTGDEWIIDQEKINVPLPVLQQKFNCSSNDPMYHCYDIDEQQAKKLEALTGFEFTLDQFDYFLEFNREN